MQDKGAPCPSRSERFGFFALVCCVLVWAIGQLFRERFWITGLCFFVPSPLIVVVVLAAAYRYHKRRLVALRWWSLAFAAAPLMMVAAVENHWTSPHPASQTFANQSETSGNVFRLVHWNTWHGNCGWSRITQVLAEFDADIYVLSETPDAVDFGAISPRAQSYSVVRVGDLTVVALGTLKQEAAFSIGKGFGGIVAWSAGKQRLSLLVADLPSSLAVARGPMLSELKRLIEKYQPDIIVGDLNSPRLSRALCDLPRGYAHSYDTAGKGWSYTWPAFCPVWAIDQCIAGSRILPVQYGLRSTLASDHRLQLLEFEIRQEDSKKDDAPDDD